jgi:hypothetical protein
MPVATPVRSALKSPKVVTERGTRISVIETPAKTIGIARKFGGRSRLAVLEKLVETLHPKFAVASGLHPRRREVMLSRRLDLLGLNLLDRGVLGRGLRRLSSDGAKRKHRTDGQGGNDFYEY